MKKIIASLAVSAFAAVALVVSTGSAALADVPICC